MRNLFICAISASLLIGCADDTEDPVDDNTNNNNNNNGGNEPTITCRLMTAEEVEDGETRLENYVYNTDLQITAVEEVDANGNITSTDSVVYDGSGMISEVHSIDSNGEIYSVINYNWDGSNLASASQSENGNTKSFTYSYNSSGKLETVTESDGQSTSSWTVLSWNGNNVDSVEFDIAGDGSMLMVLVASFDDKANVSKHFIPYPEDIIEWVNDNNILQVVTAEEYDLGGGPMPAGSKILNREYTYTAEDEVETMTELPDDFDPNGTTSVTTFTFTCE